MTSQSLSKAGNSVFFYFGEGGHDTVAPYFLPKENIINVENESPRKRKYVLRPNPTPNFTDEYGYTGLFTRTLDNTLQSLTDG